MCFTAPLEFNHPAFLMAGSRITGSIIVPVWLWHRRRLQSGICFCETAIAPMGFMACSRRLDQTGMYLKNEYSVFKGHPDFHPYKVSLTRILRFRVGLVGALWLSLQDYIRFVLTFSVFYTAGLRQKNTPLVSQRGIKDDSILFSINWYPFISW